MSKEKKYTDLTYLKEISNGSNEFIDQMIQLYMEQTPDIIKKMESYLTAGDLKAVRATAHKMKPSVGFMGISALKDVVLKIEEYAQNGMDIERISELIQRVKKVSDLAIKELEQERKLFVKS